MQWCLLLPSPIIVIYSANATDPIVASESSYTHSDIISGNSGGGNVINSDSVVGSDGERTAMEMIPTAARMN